jgi:hypothetical protein
MRYEEREAGAKRGTAIPLLQKKAATGYRRSKFALAGAEPKSTQLNGRDSFPPKAWAGVTRSRLLIPCGCYTEEQMLVNEIRSGTFDSRTNAPAQAGE